jgi:hypothetical protein
MFPAAGSGKIFVAYDRMPYSAAPMAPYTTWRVPNSQVLDLSSMVADMLLISSLLYSF